MQYVVAGRASRCVGLDVDDLSRGRRVRRLRDATRALETVSAGLQVKYDLLGEITEKTQLTRRTARCDPHRVQAEHVREVPAEPRAVHHRGRPAHQRAEGHRDRRAPDLRRARGPVRHRRSSPRTRPTRTSSKAGEKLKKHVYDYVVTDSKVERTSSTELDTSDRGRRLRQAARAGSSSRPPSATTTPTGRSRSRKASVKHVYFVAETKGSMSTLQLEVENAKIECARKFFAELNERAGADSEVRRCHGLREATRTGIGALERPSVTAGTTVLSV